MKKRKLLFLFPLAGLLLSGCDFNPEELLKNAGSFFTETIPDSAKGFVDGMLGRKEEEPEQKEEKEEKPSEQEGEGEGEQQKQKELVSISLSGQFQLDYDLGEAFNPAGLVVTAVYDDESSEDVTSQASFSGFDSSALGSCTVTVSFEGQSAEFEVNIKKLSWFAEEKALFDEYLHGIELPFFPVEGATVSEDGTGTLNILDPQGENLAVSGSTIADYAALFSADEGWDDVSSDYSAYSSAPAGSFFVFEKSTDTEEGMRRISVQFLGHDGSSYNTDGDFYLFASDPFSYEFPSDLMAQEFEDYGMTPFSLPAPDAEDLYFEFYPDANNDLYWMYGYEDYMNATIYIYGFTQETFDAYVAKLEGEGWAFTSQVYNGGIVVYSGGLEIENVGTALIEQMYFAESFTALTYDYLIKAPAQWPAEQAAALVEKFAPGSETVIPECPNGDSYDVYMSNNYNEIDVDGDESLKDEYAQILRDNNWTETEEGSYIFISPAQDIQLTLVFTSYGLEIRVAAYIPPSAQWPAEDAAKLLPEGGQDSLPPFEGADSYQYYKDNYGAGITCFVGEGNEDSAMEAYAATLLAANFTLDNNGFYRSEHDEFKVELWKGTDGAFNIEVTIIAHWPTADVAEALLALIPTATDELPALPDANSYSVTSSDTKIRVTAKYGTSSAATAAQSQYADILVGAGFDYAGDDEYGDPYFNSPNGQFCVNPWVSGSSLYIEVYEGVFVPPTAGFPADDINAALLAIDPTLTDKLPEYETELIYTFSALSSGDGVEASAMPDDVSAEISLFTANLLLAGYTEAGADTYGDMHYSSPNGQIDVCAWDYYGYYIVVDIMLN